MKDRIEIGDDVAIYFPNRSPILGTVRYMPVATGDSWIIASPETLGKREKLIYVQQFDFITLEKDNA